MANLAEARRIFSAVRPDLVFHLAGSVGAQPERELVLPTYHSLATSTVNVLILVGEYDCRRIILAGSYTEPVPGGEYPTPSSPYAAAKWISSAYGRMFHALYATPVVDLRPFLTYGPGQARSKLIPSVVLSLLKGEAPRLSSGRVAVDWVYIDDIVDAFMIAAATAGIEGGSFDLGSGKLTPVRTVVEELVKVMGLAIEPQFGALPDRPAENEIAAKTELAAERLDWRATTSLQDGLRQTAEWYKANPAPASHELERL